MTVEIELEGNTRLETRHYGWIVSSLESNYTFTQPQTDKTLFEIIVVGTSLVVICIILYPKITNKGRKVQDSNISKIA